MIGCAAIALCGAALSARSPVSLVATPARVVLAGRASETVSVRNAGSTRVVVDVSRSRYAVDLRGRPRVVAGRRTGALWLRVEPARIALAPGKAASVRVASALPRGAEPGDHPTLVLLTTRPVHAAGVHVRMRLGVVVVVRAPGRVVHRIVALGIRSRIQHHRRTLELLLANRGNVTESISGGCVRVDVRRGRQRVAVLRPLARDLLPRTRGLVVFRYPVGLRGRYRAVVVAASGTCGVRGPRTFPLRL